MTDNKLYTLTDALDTLLAATGELCSSDCCVDPYHKEIKKAAAFVREWEAREGSLRTPAAPQIAERIACQLDIDEPGTSPETHAYNVRWITAIIESARDEASQPAPTKVGDYSCALCGFGLMEPCEHWKKMIGEAILEEEGFASEAQPAPAKSDICRDCHKPVTGSVHVEMVSGNKMCFPCFRKLAPAEVQPTPQPTPHERYVNLDPPQGAFTITPADPPISGTLTPGAAESSAQPTLIETLGQTAPGAVPWSPVAIESPAQPSPGKICKQCGKPFTDTTMWQLRVSCDECTFSEAAASPSAEPTPGNTEEK